jgi:hypothetical protein
VVTGSDGRFKICLFLHDTDEITLATTAPGFASVTDSFGGYGLYSTGQPNGIGLTPTDH